MLLRLTVAWMACPRCGARVAAALRTPGVRRTRVAWRRGVVYVSTDGDAGVEGLVRATGRAAEGTRHRDAVTEARSCRA